MSFDFNALKKRRGKSVETLAKKVEQETKGGGRKQDERLFHVKRDDDGNAYKVIRFLPITASDVEHLEKPWVKEYSYGFKGPGGWYIEKALTTHGNPDPVAELNSAEWDDNDEDAKNRVRERRRTIKYYANIYVIKDKENPENEGKNMIYKFGPAIFKKISECFKPQFEDDPKFDPFDLWEGADFVMKVFTEQKGTNKFPNYDKCQFKSQAPLFEEDEKLEKVWKAAYPLNPFNTEGFKTYDELKTRLETVLKRPVGGSTAEDASESAMQSAPEPQAQASTQTTEAPASAPAESSAPASDAADDDIAFFENL